MYIIKDLDKNPFDLYNYNKLNDEKFIELIEHSTDKSLSGEVLKKIIDKIKSVGKDNYSPTNLGIDLLCKFSEEFLNNLPKSCQMDIFNAMVSVNDLNPKSADKILEVFEGNIEKINKTIFKNVFQYLENSDYEFKKRISSTNRECLSVIQLYLISSDIKHLIDKVYKTNLISKCLQSNLEFFQHKYLQYPEYVKKANDIIKMHIQ